MKSKLQRALLLLLCCATLAGCQKDANIQTDTEKSTADTVLDTETETEAETEAENTPEWAKPVSLGKITDSDTLPLVFSGMNTFQILPMDCSADVVPTRIGTIAFSCTTDRYWWYSEEEERPFWNEPAKQVISAGEPANVADPEYERVVISRTLTPLTAFPENADVYGTTPSGHAFAFTCTPGEERDTYEGILQFDNENGIAITYYSYDFDENFVETVLLPKMESCRVWINGLGEQRMDVHLMDVQHLRESGDAQASDTPYGYILTLPDSLEYSGNSVVDIWDNVYRGIYTTKRLEAMSCIYDTPWIGYVGEDPDEQALAEAAKNRPLIEGVTKAGQKYTYCTWETETENRLRATWYFFSVQVNGMAEGNYVYLSALTYETDPDGYFADVLLPTIEGITFYNTDLTQS